MNRTTTIVTMTFASTSAFAAASVDGGAAYLPDDAASLMPELQQAIQLVAQNHPGCVSIDNASLSDSYSTPGHPAFFVSCAMDGSMPYQNVYVQDGRIVGTKP